MRGVWSWLLSLFCITILNKKKSMWNINFQSHLTNNGVVVLLKILPTSFGNWKVRPEEFSKKVCSMGDGYDPLLLVVESMSWCWWRSHRWWEPLMLHTITTHIYLIFKKKIWKIISHVEGGHLFTCKN